MRGEGQPGSENINTRRMNTYAAKRLGQSAIDGTLNELASSGGGIDNHFNYSGNTGDWTAGAMTFRGKVSVSSRDGGYSARGFVTGQDEMFDFNSNPNRSNNQGVVTGGEILDWAGGEPFEQRYYGTIYFQYDW